MKIGDLCSRDVVSAPADASLQEVARLMCERHVGAVIITRNPLDGPVAAGIITDRDIVRAQADRPTELAQLRAADVMTRDPLAIVEDDSVADAIGRLRARGVRRAPVVTRHGALAGLISTDDLFAELSDEIAGLANLFTGQPRHERG